MKKSKILAFLCIMVGASLIGSVTAATYVGIDVGDAFVWEITDGEETVYAKYEITNITVENGFETATANYSTYDVEKDKLLTYSNTTFLFYYIESTMNSIALLKSMTEETKTYGGLERDCFIISNMVGYTGNVTVDEATGVLLEMEFSSVGSTGSFKLVSWEDEDLEDEYKASGIPGYELTILGIFTVIPIVYYMRKYRK